MFADQGGESEGSVDTGGPTRELLCLGIKAASDLPIFEGCPKSKQLCNDASGGKLVLISYYLSLIETEDKNQVYFEPDAGGAGLRMECIKHFAPLFGVSVLYFICTSYMYIPGM